MQDLAFSLLTALQILPAARLLPSKSGGTVRNDLVRLISAVASIDFDVERIKPLLKICLVDASKDEQIWDIVDVAAVESTPPPRAIASSLQQIPWVHKTSSFANSSECCLDVDRVLKSELGPLYVGLPDFRSKYFGDVSVFEQPPRRYSRDARKVSMRFSLAGGRDSRKAQTRRMS